MKLRFTFTIGRKIYAIIALSFVGFLGVTYLEMTERGRGLENQKEQQLRYLAALAVGIVKEEYAAAQSGSVTTAQAQKNAAARVAGLRYSQDGYFWINDMHPTMVMHPLKPEMNGSDISQFRDPNGKQLFAEMVDVVKQHGDGFVHYEWPKPGAATPQPKLSYVAGFAPWGWVVGTGVYIDDVAQETWEGTRRSLLITGVVLLLTLSVSVIVARRTSSAMRGLVAAMGKLAAGMFDVVLPGIARGDEIGLMARAVGAFKLKAAERARLEAEQEASKARDAAAVRKAEMHKLADTFESAVGSIVNTVSSAATELEASAGTLTDAAETTQQLSGNVGGASERASSNVQSVAAATEELSSSVIEISRQVHESSRIAGEAVKQAEETDRRITDLSLAASRIGDVVKLISDIAGQTNLLALNATIEAARAGESGRGFAVVAAEVKSLANQTAKATEEISSQIGNIQATTQESVASIKDIGATIKRVSEIATSIAGAVEEQHAATQEITRNVHQAAESTAQVADNIADVDRRAGETGSASGHVLNAAQSLARESNQLRGEVDKFLATVRAA
jgi:methyl-accepting chemotaxis protein